MIIIKWCLNSHQDEEKFTINADIIDKNGYTVPVFEVKSQKRLFYRSRYWLLKEENETISVEALMVETF